MAKFSKQPSTVAQTDTKRSVDGRKGEGAEGEGGEIFAGDVSAVLQNLEDSLLVFSGFQGVARRAGGITPRRRRR